MSYYYQHAVDRTVSLLMNKQYPEREMVLEDDVIVLTKVDISCTNNPGEMEDSDEDSENELMQVYINESDLELLDDDDDDIDEFIDDRPENELSENSDDSGEEDKEYDSDLQNGNDSEGESEDESEPENGPDSNNGNGEENESNSDSDSDDEPIQSPRKKSKVDIFKEDSSSESSNEGNDNDRPSCNSDSLTESSNVENEADNVGDSTDPRGLNSFPGTSWMEKSNGKSVQKKHVNKFAVFLLPKIDRKLTCLRYHGRIGMKGIKGHCGKMSKTKFCNLINKKRNTYGFTRLNLMYANARHLECRKAESALEKPVRKLLIHLIDQWFPLGIPQLLHLNRAVDLLECLKKKIGENKMPHSKYSNKFYALIPHQGDNQRRERFKTIEHCDNKIKYVNKMQSAIECLTEAEYMRQYQPFYCMSIEQVHNDPCSNAG
ncbi:uncharacterized protein LOC129580314 [Sitodiplosis mosellana]|uniref:uncharacterized protein LOC129580314 n=1 Tax=Sitodiplosis mosellana TaxID=263140 RepID=UPI002443A0E2|nr:uncharacterized protein LOC129580314 [Sitodiplosis mosellana]